MFRRVFAGKHDQRKESGRQNTLPPPAKAEDNCHHALLSTPEKLSRTAVAEMTDKCPHSHLTTGLICPQPLGYHHQGFKRGLFRGNNHSDHKLPHSCSPNSTRQN